MRLPRRLTGTLHSPRLQSLGIPVLLIIASAVVAFQTFPYSYDDAYITYRYSYNLATGSGFAYHPGETQLGTTAPFYALLLGILAIPNPEAIPNISGGLSGLALFAGALAIAVYSHQNGQPFVGLFAAMPFIFLPLYMEMFGGEVIFLTAMVLWAFVAYDAGRYVLAGSLLGLAVGVRGDAIIPLAVLSGHYLLTRKRLPWRFGLSAALFAGPWVAFSLARYGTFFPDTLSAKLAQSESGLWPSLVEGSVRVFRMYLGPRLVTGPAAHPSLRVYVFLLIPGLAAVVFRSRYWFLPLVSAGLQLIGYRMLGVPFYHWYLAPTVLIVSVATGVALGALVAILRKSAAARLDAGRKLPVQAVAVVAAFGLLLPPLWEGAKLPLQNGLAIQQAYPAETYRAVGEWLAAATPEDATVGYIEIGYIGYYSRRNIIDPLGLVTPGALPHVREADISWAYRERLPDYILVNPRFDGLLGPFDQEPWFSSCYRLAATFEPIQVFRRCEVVPKDDLVVLEQAQPRNDQPAGELLPQRSIGQTFVARQDRLRTVGLLLATYGNQVEGPLVFYLQAKQHAGSGQNLVKLELDMSLVENNSWKLFSFPPIEDSAGKEYYAYLEAPYTLPGQTITAWSTVDDSYPDGTLMLQHQPRSGDLALRLYYVRPGD